MNIIYFGYDLFAPCLRKLLEMPDVNVLKIYSFESDGIVDFNDEIKGLAAVKKIPFTEEKITKAELNYQFSKNKCDLAFCAGYAYRIPVESVANFKGINLHPSLLPDLRGPWPMPYIILKELKTSGVTAHILSEKFDDGDVMLQKKFLVSENENYKTLNEKIAKAGEQITEDLFKNLNFYFENAKEQGEGEYLPEPSDFERTIFKDTPKEKRELILRAFGEHYAIFSNKNEKEGM